MKINGSYENKWFLDSGCNNHMCGIKLSFFYLDENYSHLVKLRNNTSMGVLGMCNIRFQANGREHVITVIFFKPDLKNNLQNKNLTIMF